MERVLIKNSSLVIEKEDKISLFFDSIKNRINRIDFFSKSVLFFAFLVMSIFIAVIISLFLKLDFVQIKSSLNIRDTLDAYRITISSSLISIFIISILGTLVSYFLVFMGNKTTKFLELTITLPMVLPPAITGIALLVVFNRNNLLGKILWKLGIQVSFSYIAVIFVQVFVSLPIFVIIVKTAFEKIQKEIIEEARVSGASELVILTNIIIPINQRQIGSALILCMLRSIGEFGATMMFAGNLPGKTQTVSTYIYSLVQTNIYTAIFIAVLHLIVFIVPFFALNSLLNRDLGDKIEY